MDEEKEKPEDKKPEAAEAGDDEGSKPETTTLVDEANTAAERLEKANERKAELLRQEQELEARKALGGKSDAGQQSEKPKKLTDAEYAEALQKGEVDPLKEDGFVR